MDITKELKRRFCKNCNIPINLFEEPYFTDRLELLDGQYGTMAKYSRFLGSIEPFETEQQYYEHYNGVKDAAINAIKASAGFDKFNNMDMTDISATLKDLNYPSSSIYKPSFDGQRFISIDMHHANFSSLYHFAPDIFNGKSSWESFIAQFTDDLHVIESKYIRQVVLGNCNPKRHITYEKYLMASFLSLVVSSVPSDDIVSFTNDEIVIKDNGNIAFIKQCAEEYMKKYNIGLKVEAFKLRKFDGDLGYIKLYDNGTYKLKCVDSEYIHMIIRSMEMGEITNGDLCFWYKDTVATFNSVPKCITDSKVIHAFHAHKVKKYLIQKLIKYFGLNDEDGTYYYMLNRVKSAFELGTMTLDDFTEISENELDDLARCILEMGEYYL